MARFNVTADPVKVAEQAAKDMAKKQRPSSTGGPGPKNVDMSNWRRQIREGRLKFDDDAKQRFLDEYCLHGRMMQSARAAGVSLKCVDDHLKNDPEFADAFDHAKQAYRDVVHAAAKMLAIDGVEEPIIGGKDRDEVVGYKRTFAPAVLLAELRRVDPGYKERQEVDLNVRGGVLVAPSQLTPAEWAAQFGKPTPDSGEKDPTGSN